METKHIIVGQNIRHNKLMIKSALKQE